MPIYEYICFNCKYKFDKEVKRITAKTAITRNQLMIELADKITVGFVSEGGNLKELLKQTKKKIIKVE